MQITPRLRLCTPGHLRRLQAPRYYTLVMSTVQTWQTTSIGSADTSKLGELLGSKLAGGEVVELRSDLGGGKTTFTQGLAKGLGSKDIVSSPTFTLKKVYRVQKGSKRAKQNAAQGDGENRKRDVQGGTSSAARSRQRSDASEAPPESPASAGEQGGAVGVLEIHHFDFYRLNQPGIIADQLSESVNDKMVVTVIEWSGIVKDVLPEEYISVELKPTPNDPDERAITISYPSSFDGPMREIETEWAGSRP